MRYYRAISSFILFFGGCATCPDPAPTPAPAPGPATVADPLGDVTLGTLPAWTDRYRDSNSGDMRFFKMGDLMRAHALSRLQAVELQNHYRDLSRSDPAGSASAWFSKALARVKSGEHESRLDAAKLDKARFIVVFDLDETLYDQRIAAGASCADITFTRAGGKTRHIKRVPGWSEAFDRVLALGGAIVLFSANLDDSTRENLAHWMWRGKALLDHENIAGVMTNSYLTMQSTHEGAGRGKARRGTPVPRPSKDLRHLDESLSKVIIVDDNPTRLFQLGNVRVFKKLDADRLCSTNVAAVGASYEKAMSVVVDEIEEAVRYMDVASVTFAEAYRPYTMLGREAVRFLRTANGWDEARAVALLRQHPQLIDAHF